MNRSLLVYLVILGKPVHQTFIFVEVLPNENSKTCSLFTHQQCPFNHQAPMETGYLLPVNPSHIREFWRPLSPSLRDSISFPTSVSSLMGIVESIEFHSLF